MASVAGIPPPFSNVTAASSDGFVCPPGMSCVPFSPKQWVITASLSSWFVGLVWGVVAKYLHSQYYGKSSIMKRIPAMQTIIEDIETAHPVSSLAMSPV